MNKADNILGNSFEVRNRLNEYEIIKALESFEGNSKELSQLLEALAEIGTMKGLQHLERLDNKKRFLNRELDFTKAMIAARHHRPYQLHLAETHYEYDIKGNSNLKLEKADSHYISNVLEHHLNTTYGFKLQNHNGYLLNADGQEVLLLLGNGRESKLYNALLDSKGMHGLIYQHCKIRLKWCLSGFIFSEPNYGEILFNIFSTTGKVLFKGKGKALDNKISIKGINNPDNSRIHSCFEAEVVKNELRLINGVLDRPMQIRRNLVPQEH